MVIHSKLNVNRCIRLMLAVEFRLNKGERNDGWFNRNHDSYLKWREKNEKRGKKWRMGYLSWSVWKGFEMREILTVNNQFWIRKPMNTKTQLLVPWKCFETTVNFSRLGSEWCTKKGGRMRNKYNSLWNETYNKKTRMKKTKKVQFINADRL